MEKYFFYGNLWETRKIRNFWSWRYGAERLIYYKMLPERATWTTSWEYPMEDDSAVELDEFFQDIRLNRQPTSVLNRFMTLENY